MNIKEIENTFKPDELIVIKKFLKYVSDNTDFSDQSLNQFSDLAETDEQITESVKEWLRLKKVRLRGNQTNN